MKKVIGPNIFETLKFVRGGCEVAHSSDRNKSRREKEPVADQNKKRKGKH